ncbi:hypothetical protein [Mobilicoccus pelagius]|uniref:Glycosyltransferase RgtA/B/C/D-like domain-containing protein n=1 Tax=Mobilicoccus pelagius NBRC 104925 TaxID=1089455 RepID=H5UQV2_9MICO|nr:hypothetical protein [Mobilicoccus pelagius]GAB48110.1 hypothetical protein MOPEL_060_00260 [Mobilicoccus pelagius NBRC 104925]
MPHSHVDLGEDDIPRLRMPLIDVTDGAVVGAPPGAQAPVADVVPRRTWGRLACAGALAGAVGAVLPAPLAVVAVLLLVGLVPGSVLLATLRPVPRPLAVVAAPAIGLSLVSLLVSAELGAGTYVPGATRWLLVLVGAVGGGLLLRGESRHAAPRRRTATWLRPTGAEPAVLGLVVVALALWAWAVPSVRGSAYSSYGLLAHVPVLAVSAVLAACAVLWALRSCRLPFAWLALVAWVVVRRGVTLVGTEAPLYQWTYRHLGVMDLFSRTGSLARDVDVYSNWPGALALWAWVSDVSGVSRFDLASWYTPLHHLALAAVVYALARAFGLTRRPALLAAFVVEVSDWVGQDYLAPQSFAFLLAGVVLTALLVARDGRVAREAIVVASVVFAGIVWAHQLTPMWLLAVIVAFVLLGVVRPVALVPFLALHALMLVVDLPALLEYSTGISLDLLGNAGGNISSPVSPGQSTTSVVVSVLAVALWGAAAWVVVSSLRRGRRAVLVPAVVAFSPLLLLATGYGGEAIYRIYLYSLPGVALLLAPRLWELLHGRRPAAFVAGALTLVVALAGLQGSLGGWYAGLVHGQDVDLAGRLEQAAGPRGAIITPTVGFPLETTWRYADQKRADAFGLHVWSMQNELSTGSGIDGRPVARLTDATRRSPQPAYVVVSEAMRVYAAQYGALPEGGLDEVERLLESEGWTTVVNDHGTRVFANPAGADSWRRLARG